MTSVTPGHGEVCHERCAQSLPETFLGWKRYRMTFEVSGACSPCTSRYVNCRVIVKAVIINFCDTGSVTDNHRINHRCISRNQAMRLSPRETSKTAERKTLQMHSTAHRNYLLRSLLKEFRVVLMTPLSVQVYGYIMSLEHSYNHTDDIHFSLR